MQPGQVNLNRVGAGLLLLLLPWLLQGCGEGESPGAAFVFEVPPGFPEPGYTFDNNPLTKEGFLLGKQLFFDPALSRDGSIACSSCHAQSVAFADPQHRLSIGIEDRIGKRNAPGIFNLAFRDKFFWDGGVIHVDFIAVNAIEATFEMDNDISVILERLRADPSYREQFSRVFGGDTINSGRLLHALSQFLVSLVSANSPYDQYRYANGTLSDARLRGLSLFEEHCSSCHSGPLFTNQGFANNGLDSSFERDEGRAIITERAADQGKFLIPSLRNVAMTAPYMHDGRLATLEEVMDHYASGVMPSATLAPVLQGTGQPGIALSAQDKSDLIDFLQSLTDTDFITNPQFRRNTD